MKILVTGCAGFIGFHTALNLLSKNNKVYGLDSLNSYYDKNLKKKIYQLKNKIKNGNEFIL